MEKVKENIAVYHNTVAEKNNTKFFSIQQIIEIPEDHRLIIDVPCEIPAGKTVITFTPAETEPKKVSVFGCAKGQFKMAKDFNEPLEDFKDYM